MKLNLISVNSDPGDLKIKSSASNPYDNMEISRFAHMSSTSITKLASGHFCSLHVVQLYW